MGVPVTVRPTQTLEALAEAANDRVPTIDDPGDTKPAASYRDWVPEQTMVLRYTTDPARYPKDRAVRTVDEARQHATDAHGRILEFNEVPGRFFFRVYRARTGQGAHQ